MKLILFSLVFLLNACVSSAEAPKQKLLRMATTTSTDNTGLLKAILPQFEKDTGYEVQVVAVGTGKALKMGRDGDVDLVLVHARSAEEEFISEGFGTQRQDVMYNEFILVGPKSDPADIKSAKSAAQALTSITENRSTFISRGDDSGTHKKEQGLWRSANLTPKGKWYLEAGQGMGKIIQIAGELDGYTLTDSGTWLVYKKKSPLVQLYQGDEALFNPYGIIAVSPERHEAVNHSGAQSLIHWITSAKGQKLIGNFQFHGERLFIPNAARTKTVL